MTRKFDSRTSATIFSATVSCFMTVCLVSAARAAEPGADESKQPPRTNSAGLTIHRRTADDAKQMEPNEMLSDLRDVRLSLGQVKQQAVNLFLESTRIEITPASGVLVSSPTTINESMLNKKHHVYLAPRKEWLVYYINTLEPIIQLLIDDIYDVDTNERLVPKKIEQQINPLWKTWSQEVNSIRKSMDKVQEAIGENDSNLTIGREAVSIYQKADILEKTRYKVYGLFRAHYIHK
ncbi:hypothetical protein BH10CYA1_BH10CYA1_22790 [soil metagenome]